MLAQLYYVIETLINSILAIKRSVHYINIKEFRALQKYYKRDLLVLHNLKSIIKIINRKIKYNLKPAYKKIITELRLYYYINLKKIYNRLRDNLKDRKNKITNLIIKVERL